MVTIDHVRDYWENNPLSAAAIPHPLHTPEYFEFYDRLREHNEGVDFSEAFYEYAAFSGKKVLDVGCGNGYVLSRYARGGADVYGVDLTPTAVELSERRFELMNLDGTFAVASAEALPFGNDEFDGVCSIGVVHHTPNTAKAVGEIHRVLKPAGRAFLMVYHRDSVMYQLKFRMQSIVRRKTMQQLVNEVDGIGNPKGEVYSRTEFARLLGDFEDLEFIVRLLQGWMIAGRRLTGWVPERWLRLFQTRWGWFLYAKGRKPRPAWTLPADRAT
jgi:2-polyprenyl-3-methyl-5-hydroxy-6-metoxy-1,4-benzoquinol methylase